MADMKKWLRLMESIHPVVATPPEGKSFTRDATVVLGPNVGGGVGRFVKFTDRGSALIDVKGVIKEFACNEFAAPERDLHTGNDWFHMSVLPGTPGTQNDKPEFRPGDMVKIADVYGAVIGPGLGVFIGYGTTGEDCIVLFDGEQIVVPVKNVAAVLEQEAKDNFNEVDNDGNLSPMSFGSENVRIEQEPAMDQRDEFTKWMEAVEEALKSEGQEVIENISHHDSECACRSWDCSICFPLDNDMSDMRGNPTSALIANIPLMGSAESEVCASCGQPVIDGHIHEGDVVAGGQGRSLGDTDNDIAEIDDLLQAPMEELQHFNQAPRSKDGRGVKLGDIVQKTEYRMVGDKSPLTYGDSLEETSYDDSKQYSMSDYEIDDPQGYRAFQDEMRDGPKSEEDIEAAMDMISSIKYMQQMGLSRASRDYSEQEMASMGLPQLRQIHQEVTGTVWEKKIMNLESVDPDVAAMLKTLQSYDKMVAEARRKPDFMDVDKDGNKKESWKKAEKDNKENVRETDDKNPWEKKADDKKDDNKVTKTHKGGTVTKTDTGLVHKSSKYGNQKDEVKESSEVDPEVLEWMARLAKVAR